MSMARSIPLASMNLRKAFGERQNSSICSKLARFFFISSSAWGLNISIGWIWMWQSVIIRGSTMVHSWPARLTRIADNSGRDSCQDRTLGKNANHLAAILGGEGRCREGLGSSGCQVASRLGDGFVDHPPGQQLRGTAYQQRRRVHCRDADPGMRDV